MKHLNIYSKEYLNYFIKKRPGETKLGSCLSLIDSNVDLESELKEHKALFVLFGIKEDVGVVANKGIPGTLMAWETSIKYFLNIQENKFNKAEQILILGHLDFSVLIESIDYNNTNYLDAYRAVEEIDIQVTYLIELIVSYGKIPIIIGGGHNNCYGNIRGTSQGLGTNINVVNLDSHADFRPLEGRHSGNGFHYAFKQKYLDKYFIIGLHENYNTQYTLKEIEKNYKQINFITFDDIEVRRIITFQRALDKAKQFIDKKAYGIELDMDSIEQCPSSAMSPSGLSVNQARRYVHYMGLDKNAKYLHICEGAPNIETIGNKGLVGKLISYLILDFIKAKNNYIL